MDRNRKLKPEDVTVMSAGEQIRRKILGSGRSVEEFARAINLFPVSVKQYLRRDDGGSATFKIKLTQYFQQSYGEIVKDPQNQILDKCRELSDAIHLYTTEADAAVIEKIEGLVSEMSLECQRPWMTRNLAMNHFYRGHSHEAAELLERAFEAAKRCRDDEAFVAFSADLALVQYYRCEYEKALHWIRLAEKVADGMKDLGPKLRFLVGFRKGVVMTRLKQYESAEECFRKALEHASEDTFRGLAYLHQAEAQYKQGLTEQAKDSYRLALSALENDLLRQSFVYNSFAEMLLAEGDLHRACMFAEKAMTCCEGDNVLYSFQHFETYAKIRSRMGAKQQVFEQLVYLVDRANSEFVYRNQILEALRILVDCYDDVDIPQTQQLENLFVRMIESADGDEVNYLKELKSMLGEILLKSRQRERATS